LFLVLGEKDSVLTLQSDKVSDAGFFDKAPTSLFGGGRYEKPADEEEGVVYRRGLSRNLVIAIDMGQSMEQSEPKPSRLLFVVAKLKAFVSQYFAVNPLSQLALVESCQASARLLSPLSSSLHNHLEALDKLTEGVGEVSVQNTLAVSLNQLRHIAAHQTRELLLVWSALSTVDPGDVYQEMAKAAAAQVQVSVLHLNAQIYVLSQLTLRCQGRYTVMVDPAHFDTLLQSYIRPPLDQRAPQHPVALVPSAFPRLSPLVSLSLILS
jgi:transcription initiation factor TFIIH subunit 2